jgi:uncharacterized protein YaaQ
MKLILAIVSVEDVDELTHALLQAEFRVTIMATMGGFLRRQHATLLIGVGDAEVERAMALIEAHTRPHRARFPFFAGPRTQALGAATVFVLNVAAVQRY